MIRRMSGASHVGMVISSDSDDDEPITFCSTCMAMGQMNRLKQRLYLDNKTGKALPPPPDAEDWLQCWKCGNVVALRDTKKQGKISGIRGIEPIQNKFDEKKGIVLGLDDSGTVRKRYSRLRNRQTKHPDAEVQRMIDAGYELKDYQTDADTLGQK